MYHKFDNIDGGKIGTKSRDAKIENTSEKLFGFFLTFEREVRVNTGTTMHSNSPTNHVSHFYLTRLTLLCYPSGVCFMSVWSLQLNR